MTSIALVFPHTRLAAALAPLTLIFRPALLRPVADANGCSLPACPCQAIDPPPLGEHLPRFMSLIADITAKGAAEGMSRLLLEAKGHRPFDDDETSRRLAANIMAAHGPQSNESLARFDDLLWNERLLLTLAEFADDEEAGINDKWRQLDGRYHQVLAGLHGDDEPVSPDAAMPPPAMDDSPRLASQYMVARLKAWSRLYFVSDAKPVAVWACLEEAAEEVFEMRTAKGGETAVALGEIALSSCLSENEGRAGQDHAGLAEMAGRLGELLAKEQPVPDDLRAFGDAWRQKLDQCFPATSQAGSNHGRLRFYDLGNLPLGAVLGGQGQLAASGRFLAVWQPGP
ncbi:MAG: hypothetical protein LBH14_08820 [Desulfobulbaceae bacterium]|jgi:hypothetical protein|nr:hypothetical protein [Desulfobulbaceae bacterium]